MQHLHTNIFDSVNDTHFVWSVVVFSVGMAVVHFCFSINLNTGLSPPKLLCLAGCCHSVCKVWRWLQFE